MSLTVQNINTYVTDFAAFREALAKLPGDMSESGEISLFQTLLKDIRDRECAATRSSGGGFRKPPAGGGDKAGATSTDAPSCPVHHKTMRQSRDGGFYCPCKNPDGSYCTEKA
jgi:hypothetical protein